MQKIKFRFSADHVDSFPELGKLRAVFIDLTNRCNLNCKYCFNHRALQLPPLDLDIDLIEKALDSKQTEFVNNWFLSGGEPFLYPHLSEALKLFRDRGIAPKIATNGIKLTPKMLDTLVEFGVPSVQFSLETLKSDLHTSLNGSQPQDHTTILSNLAYAVNSPLRVVVSSVLTEANKREIEEIIAFCFQSGVDSYTLYPNVPSEDLNRNLIVPFPEILEVIDELFSAYMSLSSTKVIDITVPCFSESPVYTKWKDTLDLRLHYCAAAQFALKITCDGRVSACICQDGDPFIIGDLRKDGLDDIWISERAREFRSLYEKIPECSLCARKEICRGGCRNNASLLGSKGMHSPDPYCQFLKSCVE
jgi:radical SAM protein with 4Fe4S-binding SPASM domain